MKDLRKVPVRISPEQIVMMTVNFDEIESYYEISSDSVGTMVQLKSGRTLEFFVETELMDSELKVKM